MPTLYGAGDRAGAFAIAGQAPYQRNYILNRLFINFDKITVLSHQAY